MKPAAVVSYNNSKAGVDRMDQMTSYYSFNRKTVKWWKKLFFYLINIGIVNSHRLFRMQNAGTSAGKMPLDKYMR
jgi:hypothetical protein